MRRALHAFLLAFVFLLAQAGLSAHAASHVAVLHHADDQGLPSDAPCDLCVGYAQLAGGAPLPDAPGLPACLARYEQPEHCTALSVSRFAPHSRARAPPALS
jgi:hypothetical protein